MPISGNITAKFGGGGDTETVTQNSTDIRTNEENIALNALRHQIDAGWSYLNMVNGIADEYEDETGIDNVTSSNIVYQANNSYTQDSPDSATLLIQSDTTDGSTTFTDTAGAKTVTANGDSQHDTAQKVFGTSSMLFDGTGDYLSLANSADWDVGAGDFTIDFRVRVSSSAGVQNRCFCFGNTTSGGGYRCNITSLRPRFDYIAGGPYQNTTFSDLVMVADTWYHVAFVRNGNTLSCYLDGVASSTTVNLTGITIDDYAGELTIGAATGGENLNGHLDEVRFLKGEAVWTTNFTPPSASYDISANILSLVSESFTAKATPTEARLLFLLENTGAGTLNTDVIGSISRDGGTTFTTVTLEDQGQFDATRDIISCLNEDISAQPSGTSMVYKITTANSTKVYIHGTWLQWKE